MYAQVCTRSDIASIVGMLGRYLSVFRYLQRTKDYMLTYKKSDQIEIIGYSDSDFAGCQDIRRSTSTFICWLEELFLGRVLNKHSQPPPLQQQNLQHVMRHPTMNCGCKTGLGILSGIGRPLKLYCDNNQQFYIPTTTGTHPGQDTLTLSSWL